MATVSRLILAHPALGTAGGASLHASVEALYQKIGDAIANRWFQLTDFDQLETVDLEHNFDTDILNLRWDIYVFTGGQWVRTSDDTSPLRSAFSVIEKVGFEDTVLQITNNTAGNDLLVAVVVTNDPISLEDGDITDIDVTTSPPQDGQALVYESSSDKFKPGASGDASFKVQSVAADGTTVLKGGYIIDFTGEEYATYDGAGTASTDFGTDLSFDLDTLVPAPVNDTTYYLYVDKSLVSAAVTLSDNGRSLIAVTSAHLVAKTLTPKNMDLDRFMPIGFVRRATAVWSTTAFGTLAVRRHTPLVLDETRNYLKTVHRPGNTVGTVSDATVSDSGNRTSDTDKWATTASANINITSSTSSPLRQTASYLTTGAGNAAAGTTFVESPTFNIDSSDLGKPIVVAFDVSSVAADGDWDVCLVRYNSAGTFQEKMSVAGNASGGTPASAKLPTGTTLFKGFFIPSTTQSDLYAVRFRRLAGTSNIKLDSLLVGPQSAILGTAAADFVEDANFSFDNFGTVSNQKVYRARAGDRMVIRGSFQAGTTVGAAAAINLPAGFVLDTTKLPSGTNVGMVGRFAATAAAATNIEPTNQTDGILFFDGATTGKIFFAFSTGTTSNQFTKMNGNNFTNNQTVAFLLELPIVSWTGNITMADRAIEEYAFNTGTNTTLDDLTSFGNGPGGTPIIAQTADLTRRVRFSTPVLPTDLVILEVLGATDGTWHQIVNNESSGLMSYTFQNGTSYGFGIKANAISARTDVDVVFGAYGYANGTYGAAGVAWSSFTSVRWRVKKVSGGAAVGFPVAGDNIIGSIPSNVRAATSAALTLTVNDQYEQNLAPSASHDVTLDGTGMAKGKSFKIFNNTTFARSTMALLTIKASNGSVLNNANGSKGLGIIGYGWIKVRALQANPTTPAHWLVEGAHEEGNYSVLTPVGISNFDNANTGTDTANTGLSYFRDGNLVRFAGVIDVDATGAGGGIVTEFTILTPTQAAMTSTRQAGGNMIGIDTFSGGNVNDYGSVRGGTGAVDRVTCKVATQVGTNAGFSIDAQYWIQT